MQYVAWNSSSDLLAASSDTDCIVRVWRVKPPAARRRAATRNSPDNVATGEVVGTYNHNHPCLALQVSDMDKVGLGVRWGELGANPFSC